MKTPILLIFITLKYLSFSQVGYTDSIIKNRKAKESEILDPKNGILNEEDLKNFESLHFFFIDTNYVVQATFQKSKGSKFEMPTTTNRKPLYRRFGYLHFTVNEKKCKLTVYQNLDKKKNQKKSNYFFVPFRDLTNAEMTYGGGRYIDLVITKRQTIVSVDFNLAYNPYCAYSHRYSCPIPPEENTLNLFIYSGEKTPIYKFSK